MNKEVSEADIICIIHFFNDLEDPRSSIDQWYLLSDMIVICVAAVISGGYGPLAIGIWADAKRDWCHKHLTLPFGIPSHDTIGRLLATLKASAFQSCFSK